MFNVQTPTIGTPGPQQGLTPMLIDDIIEPRYPGGCALVFQRPGELGVVVTVEIPHGAMVMMIPAEQAVHIREMIRQANVKQRQAMEKANGLVRRS